MFIHSHQFASEKNLKDMTNLHVIERIAVKYLAVCVCVLTISAHVNIIGIYTY